jgi:hypothetical protein
MSMQSDAWILKSSVERNVGNLFGRELCACECMGGRQVLVGCVMKVWRLVADVNGAI